jgi:hypothetical protein
MKKLTLSLEHLTVESFDTAPTGVDARGTVQAHGDTIAPAGDTMAADAFTGTNSCEGPSCDHVVDTCFSPCPMSWITNCHRCAWDSEQTACVYCG